MKIKVIIPIISSIFNQEIKDYYIKCADPGTEIDVVNLERGAESIESEYDEELAAPFVLEKVTEANDDGIDGIIVFCYGNVAVDAAREVTSIPIIGLGEAAQNIASLLGDKLSVVSTIPNAIPRLWRKARMSGIESSLVSIRPMNMPVLDKNKEEMEKSLLNVGEKLKNDGADVVILGCGTLFDMEKWMESKIGLPVVSSSLAALKVIEMLIKMKLSHSKKAYPLPPEKRRIIK